MVAQFRSQEEISDMDTTGETGQTDQPPAGWYPDPKKAHTNRYFDGAKWTDHIVPAATAPPTQKNTFGPMLGALVAFALIVLVVFLFVEHNRGVEEEDSDRIFCERWAEPDDPDC